MSLIPISCLICYFIALGMSKKLLIDYSFIHSLLFKAYFILGFILLSKDGYFFMLLSLFNLFNPKRSFINRSHERLSNIKRFNKKSGTNADTLISNSFSYTLAFTLVFTITLALPFNANAAAVIDKSINESAQFESNDLYQALAAEIYNQLGEKNLAVDYYYSLSVTNKDPAIAKRVTELATVTGQIAKALNGAKRWVVLQPNNLEANQYLTLLLLRNSHFKSAAKQLDVIRMLLENSSAPAQSLQSNTSSSKNQFHSNESLTFIGAMLSAEAHHDKALTVFDLYIKDHASKLKNNSVYLKQQKLITAQLAMKAKQYSTVINSLNGLTGLDPQNYVDATVMHAKALHKLKKDTLAIGLLNLVKDHPEANDSHRLELVRLLVLNKQKSVALPILETLVTKHSKNLELLKSLVALQIDQSKLKNVESNISKLRTNINYTHDANYFTGEFAEKLGQQEKALLNYEKVSAGSYLKNAHKKRISLVKRIHGQSELNTLFSEQQRNAETLSDQAYWIKLQADELFEADHYSKALVLYDKAVKLVPKKTRYRYKRGLVNERLGNLEKAELDFNSVLAKQSNDADTLNALGYMLSVHTKRLKEAKSHIDKAYKLKPNDPLILDSLGFVLYKTGDLSKAEKYLRKAFKLMKKPEVASHLITVLAKSNQHQEARNIYLEMQRIYPNSPSLKSVLRYLTN